MKKEKKNHTATLSLFIIYWHLQMNVEEKVGRGTPGIRVFMPLRHWR